MELVIAIRKMLTKIKEEIKSGKKELASMPFGPVTQEAHQGKPLLVITNDYWEPVPQINIIG